MQYFCLDLIRLFKKVKNKKIKLVNNICESIGCCKTFEREIYHIIVIEYRTSLDGTVAYLAVVDLKKWYFKIDYFFTYGVFRIETHEFSVWFTSYVGASEHWRVRLLQSYGNSLITLQFSYKHPPQEDNKSYKIYSSEMEEDKTCANSIISNSAADHTNYFNVINVSGPSTEEFTEEIEI